MVGSHTFWWQEWKRCFSQCESESGAGTRKTGFERNTSVLPLCKLFTKVVTRVIQVITPAKTARIAIKLMTGVKMLFFPRKGNWIWAQKLSLWGAPAMHGSSCMQRPEQWMLSWDMRHSVGIFTSTRRTITCRWGCGAASYDSRQRTQSANRAGPRASIYIVGLAFQIQAM